MLQESKAAGLDTNEIAEVEQWADVGDKAAYEKGVKDGFSQRVDTYIGHIAKEMEK